MRSVKRCISAATAGWRVGAAGSAAMILALVICTAACSQGQPEPSASPEAKTGAASSPMSGAAGDSSGPPVAAHDPHPAMAGGALPPGHTPLGESAGGGAMSGSAEGGGAAAGGLDSQTDTASALTWTVPAAWTQETPRSTMRKAQFRVPRVAGDPDDAECAVFNFGSGQGGSPDSNARRWVDQFTQPDGGSSQGKSKVAMKTVNGREVMLVEVRGTFIPMAMPGGGGGDPKPGYAMIGAIVSEQDAPWFFKLTGPQKTVEANRAAFEALIASLKSGA